MRLVPDRRALWAALLKAILVDAEADGAPGLGAELCQALASAVQAATGRPPGPELAQRLDALIAAAALPAAWRSPDDDPDVVPPFALGLNAVHLVTQLRDGLGLSALYAYRQLSSQLGAAIPSPDLLRCIAAVHPSATPRPRRRQTRTAAERTLLAWIRTGLALMGLGFVVARFGLFLREIAAARGSAPSSSPGASLWLGTLLVLGGVLTNLIAARQHVRLVRRLQSGDVYRPTARSLEVLLAVALAPLGVTMAVHLVASST